MNIHDTANALGYSEKTIRRAVKSGVIPAKQIGNAGQWVIDNKFIKKMQPCAGKTLAQIAKKARASQ